MKWWQHGPVVELEFDMQLTRFGRRFFARMLDTTPPFKRNKRRGYGR